MRRVKHYILYLFKILIMLELSGCTKTITPELDTSPEKLVVESLLSNIDEMQTVRLTKTAPYLSQKNDEPVTNAKVEISSINKTYRLKEATKLPGLYYIETEQFKPIAGTEYKLKIELDKAIGGDSTKNYSSKTKMPPPVKIDSIKLTRLDTHWYISASFKDRGNGTNHYLFDMVKIDENNRYRTADLKIIDNRLFRGEYVEDMIIYTIDKTESTKIESGDIIELSMSSINSEMYNFIEGVNRETSQIPSHFAGPPANIKGNISNNALGIFSAENRDTTSLVVQ
ncbi:DUF4249 domain-containing protein [Marinilabiliaceae bacterium ANBcel2]|nr:DUF4249 domain-containing protein [Marinilabiliaceae bacterium ANBcel2]